MKSGGQTNPQWLVEWQGRQATLLPGKKSSNVPLISHLEDEVDFKGGGNDSVGCNKELSQVLVPNSLGSTRSVFKG